MKNYLLTFLFTSIFFIASGQIMYPGEVTQTGPKETVFDWYDDNCSGEMSIDGSPRAFRDADGNIQLLNMHTRTFRMVGADFDHLEIDCSAPVFDSDWDEDPSHFNYAEWLGAIWTEDGETVYGLTHSEWHAYNIEGQCLSSDIMKCWYNGICLIESVDSGRTFSHLPAPNHLVMSVPYTYDAAYQSRQGAFAPSNIVKHPTDGYYYCMFYTEENVSGTSSYLQGGGLCVMRTDNISDPSSWRVYNGEDYTTESVNPYTDTFEVEDHLLYNIGMGKQLTSLTYNTFFDMWMLVGPSAKYQLEENRFVRGFYYQLSDDLIRWSGPKLLMEVNTPGVDPYNNASIDEYGAYPTIIDHSDTSRNFMYSDQDCYLYYTVWNNYPAETSGSMNRDLRRVPIHFEKAWVSEFTINGKGNQYDAVPGDGVCATESGKCSYFALVQESNARLPRYADSLLTVSFDVSNGPVFNFTNPGDNHRYPVFFDGWTQPGSSPNTLGMEDGFDAEYGVIFDFNGNTSISFSGGNSGMRGIAIRDYSGPGVGFNEGDNNIVQGCWFGISDDGTENAIDDYDGTGMYILNSDNNQIGGSNSADRNLFLGAAELNNSHNNTLEGNYFGLSADGTTSLENNGSTAMAIMNSHSNTIGGLDPESGNVFAGGYNGTVFIYGEDSFDNAVYNNRFGTNAQATEAIGSANSCVYVGGGANTNSIGTLNAGNIFGSTSNGVGIVVLEGSTFDNTIQSNHFGTNPNGTANLFSSDQASMASVFIDDGAYNNTIGGWDGLGNVITNSHGHGVLLLGGAGDGNTISGNTIFDNGGMGIDIWFDNWPQENDYLDSDEGPNKALNYPEFDLVSVSGGELTILGTYHSTPLQSYTLEFFANNICDGSNNGEGRYFLGIQEVSTDTEGNGPFTFSSTDDFDFESMYFSATATDENGNTSEFSICTSTSVPAPEISVNPEYVSESNIVGNDIDIALSIENNGYQPLVWSIVAENDWVNFSETEGSIEPGSGLIVYINFDMDTFEAGGYSTLLTITSNDPDEGTVNISCDLTLESAPWLDYSPTSLTVEQSANSMSTQTINMTNSGVGSLNWMATAPIEAQWIMPALPNTGSLSAGESANASFNINTNGMLPGTYESEAVISSNATNESLVIIPVTLTVTEGGGGGGGGSLVTEVITDQFDFCQGAGVSFEYTATGTLQPNNTFILKMSDENGSFSNPYTLGQLSSSATNGVIDAQIPINITNGNGYRIRLDATNPGTNGNENPNDLTVHPWVIMSAPEPGNFCSLSAPQPLEEGYPAGGYWEGPGVIENTFDPGSLEPGDYELHYVYESAEGCVFKMAKTATVYEAGSVTITPVGPFCADSEPVLLEATPSGGDWTGAGVEQSSFDPTTAGAGVHSLTYQYGSADGCAVSGSLSVTVFSLPDIISLSPGLHCSDEQWIPLNFATPEGGEYWGDMVVDEQFNAIEADAGIHLVMYTYTSDDGCSSTVSENLTMLNAPEETWLLEESYCTNEEPVYLEAEGETTLEMAGEGVMNNVFYPGLLEAGTTTIQVSATGANGCSALFSYDVQINPTPDVELTLPDSLCTSDQPLVLNGGLPDGGLYAIDGTIATELNPAEITAGLHEVTYFYENEFYCMGVASESIWITDSPENPIITFDGIFLQSTGSGTVQWYLNGESIEGATASTLMPDESGIYSAIIWNETCPSGISNEIDVTITHIGEEYGSEIRVYPNPFQNKIIIDGQGMWDDETEIRLYNELGALVRFAKISDLQYSNGKYMYNEGLSELEHGIYFLLILKEGTINRAVMQKK